MDRSILEGDPHGVLEAMAIAGYAVGACKGFIYVRAEYPIAVNRLEIAIKQAKEYGLLGENIFGTGFNFDIEIRLGAGAFVCGEETALLESIEGKRGQPRLKPPFPAHSGLWGKPTLINNVETWANITKIILNGAEWYASIGTEGSKGTKVFALGGNVNNVGLVEVPMGTTLREIIYDIGGGIPNGRKFKAAQTGGPSGGCIPEQHLDTPIDYDSLKEIGSMMGSGGLIVMDDSKCMVNLARFYLEFTVDESCGKCTPCRIGTKRLLELLTKICNGLGKEGDIEDLEELANNVASASVCGLGQTAPNPVLATLKYFREEYEEHIKEKKCRAKECKKLTQILINEEICKCCDLCKKACPVNAIIGEPGQKHKIDQSKCIKCRTCMATCPFKAIYDE
jgi:NADP-reducing hydrogenase subunit HndC